MKKFLLSFLGVVAILTAVYAASTQTKNTAAGMTIATTSTQKLGFYGATPTNQLTVTVATNTADDVAATLKGLIDKLRICGLVNTN